MPSICSKLLDLVNDRLGFQLLLLLLGWRLIKAGRISLVLFDKPLNQWGLDTKSEGNISVAALCAEYGLYDPLHGHMTDLTLVKSLEPLKRVCAVEGNGIKVWPRSVFLPGVSSFQ